MKKVRLPLVLVMLIASWGLLTGCGEPVQSICNDAPKFEKAISNVDAENATMKAELLEDVGEYAASPGNCPAYAGQEDHD
jgi:hypothetical protein